MNHILLSNIDLETRKAPWSKLAEVKTASSLVPICSDYGRNNHLLWIYNNTWYITGLENAIRHCYTACADNSLVLLSFHVFKKQINICIQKNFPGLICVQIKTRANTIFSASWLLHTFFHTVQEYKVCSKLIVRYYRF